jgi:hypothetical protein
VNRFRDAKARCIASGQDRALLDALHAVKKLQDFLWTKHGRQGLRLLAVGIASSRTHLVEKADGVNGDEYRTGGKLSQVDLVYTNVLWT